MNELQTYPSVKMILCVLYPLLLQCVLYHFLLSLLVFVVNSIIITFCDQNRADFVGGENSDPSHCLGGPRLLNFIIFGLTEEFVCVPYIRKKPKGFHGQTRKCLKSIKKMKHAFKTTNQCGVTALYRF